MPAQVSDTKTFAYGGTALAYNPNNRVRPWSVIAGAELVTSTTRSRPSRKLSVSKS